KDPSVEGNAHARTTCLSRWALISAQGAQSWLVELHHASMPMLIGPCCCCSKSPAVAGKPLLMPEWHLKGLGRLPFALLGVSDKRTNPCRWPLLPRASSAGTDPGVVNQLCPLAGPTHYGAH